MCSRQCKFDVNVSGVRHATAIVAALGALAACSRPTEVPTAELSMVVQRDGIAFEGQVFPTEVLDRLASNRVVIVGETHFLSEHDIFIATLLEALHASGFRQLLVEFPHMADWILEDYVSGGELEPGWEPPVPLGQGMFAAIRDFNSTLAPTDRIHVRAIDVNLDDYGGARSFRDMLQALSQHIASPGPVAGFLQSDYTTPEGQAAALETLGEMLEADRSSLVPAWGAYFYDTITEMVEVERVSVSIRALRQDHYTLTTRLRESVIKRVADLRIEGRSPGTLINIGAHHAQKEHLWGTDQEWLGDYMVHESAVAGGSVIVLNVVPARIVSGEATVFDIRDESPENEVWRLINEAWPNNVVFLPLDDPVFMEGGVPVFHEGELYLAAPKRQYDAYVQLPLAHRVPLS